MKKSVEMTKEEPAVTKVEAPKKKNKKKKSNEPAPEPQAVPPAEPVMESVSTSSKKKKAKKEKKTASTPKQDEGKSEPAMQTGDGTSFYRYAC